MAFLYGVQGVCLSLGDFFINVFSLHVLVYISRPTLTAMPSMDSF